MAMGLTVTWGRQHAHENSGGARLQPYVHKNRSPGSAGTVPKNCGERKSRRRTNRAGKGCETTIDLKTGIFGHDREKRALAWRTSVRGVMKGAMGEEADDADNEKPKGHRSTVNETLEYGGESGRWAVGLLHTIIASDNGILAEQPSWRKLFFQLPPGSHPGGEVKVRRCQPRQREPLWRGAAA